MSEAYKSGPWYVADLGEQHFLETNHRYGIEYDGGTCQVAKVEGMGDEALATARLIAAARDLLAACQAAMEHVIELESAWVTGALHERDDKGGTRSNRNTDVREQLRTAIAAATERGEG